MKQLSRLLTFILCFELVVSPTLSSNGIFISNAQAEDCPSGFEFDSTLNRCVTSQQMAEVMNAVSNCNGDKACYKQNAEQALKDAEAEGKVKEQMGNASGLINSGMKVISIAGPLLITIKLMAGGGTPTTTPPAAGAAPKCSAMSGLIMLGASVVAFGGDMIANNGHKSRLKKIKQEWEEIIAGNKSTANSTSTSSTTADSSSTSTGVSKVAATEGQSQAFEMLAKSEDSMAKAAKMKAMIYGVAGAAYAAAAVMAGLELMKPVADRCEVTHVRNGDPLNLYAMKELKNANDLASILAIHQSKNSFQSPSIDEYELAKKSIDGFSFNEDVVQAVKYVTLALASNLMPIQSANAVELTAAASGGGGAGGVLKFMASPPGRLILGGILSVWSITMAMHASKQAKVSKNRAEFLRKMKDQFNDAQGALGCSDTERESPSAPTCYCYTAEGQRNSNRASSAVCAALFNGKNLNTSSSYLASGSNSCITKSGAEDASCTCKSSNTCASVSTSGGITGLDTGTFSMVNGALSNLNGVANGNEGANLSPLGSASTAARLLDTANKIAAKSKTGQSLLKNKKKLVGQMDASLRAGAGSAPSLGDSNSPIPTSPAAAIAELQNEFKKAESPINTASGGQTIGQPVSPNEAEPALDFSLGNEQASEATQVAEVMKQKLDYGQNDITTSNTNLFEVLSNRYQRSGMRRLFDDEGKTQADAPAKSEINQ